MVEENSFHYSKKELFKVSCFPTKSEDFILVPECMGAV